MGRMLRGFIKDGSLNQYQERGTGQEAAVLGGGTEMITTEIGTTRREAVAEAWTGMTAIDIVERTGTIIEGAGAAVPALTTKVGVEAVMMMNDIVVADQLIAALLFGVAQVLRGVLPHGKLLFQGVKVPLDVAMMDGLLLKVLHRMVSLLHLVAHHLEIQMLMSKPCSSVGICGVMTICPRKDIVDG
uniref:Serine/arginine-rich splicing factor SC35 n=2 Tax=Rhizophora mucronata TaxID=61149 RepID=A0A2P2MII0_RHIMU